MELYNRASKNVKFDKLFVGKPLVITGIYYHFNHYSHWILIIYMLQYIEFIVVLLFMTKDQDKQPSFTDEGMTFFFLGIPHLILPYSNIIKGFIEETKKNGEIYTRGVYFYEYKKQINFFTLSDDNRSVILSIVKKKLGEKKFKARITNKKIDSTTLDFSKIAKNEIEKI